MRNKLCDILNLFCKTFWQIFKEHKHYKTDYKLINSFGVLFLFIIPLLYSTHCVRSSGMCHRIDTNNSDSVRIKLINYKSDSDTLPIKLILKYSLNYKFIPFLTIKLR